jgi:SH3-like domain-containing protein
MTTPTQEALMALADAYANAKMWCTSETAEERRAALASAIAEVVQEAERWRQVRSIDAAGCAIFEFGNWGGPDPFKILVGGHADNFVDAAIAARSAAQKTAGV